MPFSVDLTKIEHEGVCVLVFGFKGEKEGGEGEGGMHFHIALFSLLLCLPRIAFKLCC